MAFEPDAIALLNQANQAYAEAKASTGVREWPSPVNTQHDCALIGVQVKPGEAEYNKVKMPCIDIFFEYSWMPTPGNPGYDPTRHEPLIWQGARARIIPGYEKNPNIKDGQKTGLRIDTERLKGAITVILEKSEKECTNLLGDLTKIAEMVSDVNRTILVGVYVEARTYQTVDQATGQKKDNIARKDWIRDRVSG